jgi:hypothetical protein
MSTKNEKISESMEGNTNAEKWTIEKATKLFTDAVELSKNTDYDFIGEIAKDLDSYIDVFDYLVEKFPELKKFKNRMKRNCEANCFTNIKKENINTGAGIMNLKSNHGWTDRIQSDHTTQGEKLQSQFIVTSQEIADEAKNFIDDVKKEK